MEECAVGLARIEVIALLERRMVEFVESQTGVKQLPVSLSAGNFDVRDIERILLQRFIRCEMVGPHHGGDAHYMDNCHSCMSPMDEKDRWEDYVRRFINTNREVFAELELLK